MEPAPAPEPSPHPELPRRLMVTGAAGFLGGTMVRRLLSLPPVQQVIGLDERPLTGFPGDPRFRPVVADLRRPPPGLVEEVEAVLHFAFRLRPSRHAADDRAVNLDATTSLLEACADAGVKLFVYPSSTTVYGAHPGEDAPHPETDPPRPVPGFRYAEHKEEAEILLRRFAARHPEMAITILRACVVLAPGADNFVTDSLRMRLLPVPAGADPEMQFLHADDLAAAVEAALRHGRGGLYNVAGKGTVRWREAIRLAAGRPLPLPAGLLAGLIDLTWKLRLQSRSTSAGLTLTRYPWLADTARAGRELGWEPKWSSHRVAESWRATRAIEPG